MLDDRVRAVLERLEAEDAKEREEGVSRELRARQVARSTGQFLFALVAPQWDCEVLEIGGSRGYSSIWLAAGVRHLGGRVLSLEADPAKVEAWRKNVAEAGLEETAELVEGDAFEMLPEIEDVFDIVFIDAEKEDYERLFRLARDKVEPGALFVADNVLSHADPLAEYSKARQADPTLESVTLPLDRGLELSVVLSDARVLDAPVREVLARLERETPRPPAVPVPPETGRFLFSLVAPHSSCEVLELGGGKGYSTIWLAAGARLLGGAVLSIERDPEIAQAWRENVSQAGLEETAQLIEGDALEEVAALDDSFDVVFIDAADRFYEQLFRSLRPKLDLGALVVADNVLSRPEHLAAYVSARQSDPTLESVTVPVGEGLELSVVLA